MDIIHEVARQQGAFLLPTDMRLRVPMMDLSLSIGRDADAGIRYAVLLWAHAATWGYRQKILGAPDAVVFEYAVEWRGKRGRLAAGLLRCKLVKVIGNEYEIVDPFTFLNCPLPTARAGMLAIRDRPVSDADRRRFRDANDGDPVCVYCLRPTDEGGGTHIDHIVPRSRGGATVPENLVVSCRDCNLKKRAKTPKEARMKIGGKP